jgi:hypothetical protein
VRLRHAPRVTAAVGLVVAVLVVLAAGARAILGAETLNATGTLGFPAWLDEVTQHSGIAYPAHAALGTVFESANLSPAATSVQWFKAAAHAESESELEQTARGISAALERDGDDSRALRMICTLKELGVPSQVRVIEQVRPQCDRWPPNVILEAVVAPRQVDTSSVVSITVSVTSATDFLGLVDVEIFDGSGHRIAQWVFEDQQLVAEQQQRYVMDWQVPSRLPPGEYTVKLGVFSNGWTALHGWKNAAATMTVTSGSR